MYVVFDLDGTIADDSHRKHFLMKEGAQLNGRRLNSDERWHAYFDLCDADTPNMPVIHTLRALCAGGHHVEIWSGRSEGKNGVWRVKTLHWLVKHAGIAVKNEVSTRLLINGYPNNYRSELKPLRYVEALLMRPYKNHVPDVELKGKWLEDVGMDDHTMNTGTPDLFFDDRNKMVQYWRSTGKTCFQVKTDDYI